MEQSTEKLELLIPFKEIARKVSEIAKAISSDFTGKPLVLLCVLKGSCVFFADLIRELTVPVHIDFISVSSYEGTAAKDEIIYHYGPRYDVEGKYVIVVEDIIDTGATMRAVVDLLKEKRAIDVKICALIKRENATDGVIEPDYTGFLIKDGFLVGYGLDFNEDYRSLKDIYTLSDKESA